MRCVGLALVVLGLAGQAGAQSGGSLRGTVLGPDGIPVAGADVEVAAEGSGRAVQARTDRMGSFVAELSGTGTFLLRIYAAGFQPRARRFEVSAPGRIVLDTTILTAREPVRVTGITVHAVSPAPAIPQSVELERTGDEEWAARSGAPLPAQLRGDLQAMAATVPGIVPAAGGVSAFGLSPEANSVTLNGLTVAGFDVPRNLRSTVRVTRSAFDPARGGFAGVQTALTIGPSYGYVTRRGHAIMAADAAEMNAASRLVRSEVGVEGGSFSSMTYSGALALSRHESERPGLGALSDAELSGAGLSRDELSALEHTLAAAGVSSGLMRTIPAHDQRATLVLRADRRPYNPGTWSVLGFAQIDRGELAPPVLSTASAGFAVERELAGLQLANTHVRGRFLTDITAGLTHSRASDPGDLGGLAGTVALGGLSPSGTARVLRFGAAGLAASREAEWTAEASLETRWIPSSPQHLLKVYLDGSFRSRAWDAEHRDAVYGYQSMAALRSNRPTSFSAITGEEHSRVAAWSLVGAFSDTWNPSGRLQLLGGARVEASGLTGLAAVGTTDLDKTGPLPPVRMHVSPRLGASWSYGQHTRRDGTSVRRPTAGILRGGVGLFRAQPPLGLLGTSGVREQVRSIRCLGEAVAVPDWRSATGSTSGCPGTGTGWTDEAASVRRASSAYVPAESWRASLAWFSRFGFLNTSVEAAYALNRHLAGWRDLNFASTPQFVLVSEGGRPVYAPVESVDPATGETLALQQRLAPELGRVLRLDSDLRSVARQVTIRLTPELGSRRASLSLAYTRSAVREQFRGFDGAAFGDPARVEWAPGSRTPDHQILISGMLQVRAFGYLALFANLASGLPYTALVSGDANGDGLQGDRAFVFAPGAADPTAGGLGEVIAAAPRSARRCLLGAVGGPARRNACRTDWSRMVNLSFATSRTGEGSGRRLDLDVQLVNVLAGADRLLNGVRTHGWDGGAPVDPVLYRVTGFDPDTRAFRYQANSGFGRPIPLASRAPFQLVIDLSFDVGPSIDRQAIRRAMQPQTGSARPPVDVIRDRLGYIGRNLYPHVLQVGDELMLDAAQVAALDAAEARYQAEVNVLREDLAHYLASLPDDRVTATAVRRQRDTDRAALRIVREHARGLRKILTPFQVGLLPSYIRDFMTIEI